MDEIATCAAVIGLGTGNEGSDPCGSFSGRVPRMLLSLLCILAFICLDSMDIVPNVGALALFSLLVMHTWLKTHTQQLG